MLRVICIVYLFSLANGLLLVALDRTFGPSRERAGTPAEEPSVEVAGSEALFARVSFALASAAAFQALLHRWVRPH